jgi:signal transduction histidine kinase
MSESTAHGLLAAYFLVVVVWVVVAQWVWSYRRTRRLRSGLSRLLLVAAGVLALHYLIGLFLVLVPRELAQHPTPWLLALYVLGDVAVVVAVAVFRHFLRFVPGGAAPPGPAWLAANYGLAVLAIGIAELSGVLLGLDLVRWGRLCVAIVSLYVIVLFLVSLRQLARIARRGPWTPGAMAEARDPDLRILAGGLLALVAVLAVVGAGGGSFWNGVVLLDLGVGVLVAVPFLVRGLGAVIPAALGAVTAVTAGAGVYLGGRAAHAALAGSGLGAVVDLAAIVTLVLVLGPVQARLRAGLERLVHRRTRRRGEELQAFMHTLTPELGTVGCCRRALAELVRVMQLRGAAILLGDGELVAHGEFASEPLRRVWSGWDARDRWLLAPGFGAAEMHELPPALREALVASDVVGVLRVASPRADRGHLFLTAGLLGTLISDEDSRVLVAFSDQLALVLDGAELLARAVGVERSLAHAEKLAAIGELAARIAHEIRNPVTAARSLAQQLAREPGVPFAAEHALILAELERVERQVAGLLRFARREDFAFAPVDLGVLAGATVESLRRRLEAAGVEVALDAPGPVVARADAEKIRQVMINLIENAIDAMAGTATRRLTIALANGEGAATLRVSDTGPGVAAETLARLFEPFFSMKDKGTGLGLAIAKRTVDAHGGRIAASSTAGAGLTVSIELPLGDAP